MNRILVSLILPAWWAGVALPGCVSCDIAMRWALGSHRALPDYMDIDYCSDLGLPSASSSCLPHCLHLRNGAREKQSLMPSGPDGVSSWKLRSIGQVPTPSRAQDWGLGSGNSGEKKDSFNKLNRMERQTHTGSESGFGIRKTWIQIPALPFLSSTSKS